METGEALIRITIWAALVAYTAGEVSRGRPWPWLAMNEDRVRVVWTLGCVLYIAHVAAAFEYDYRWSHAVAYTETARQTDALLGISSGVGIFVNYLFTLIWIGETLWWWLAPATYHIRATWIGITVRSVFCFMIINGAVVFVTGPMRWVGTTLVILLAMAWWPFSRRPLPAANR